MDNILTHSVKADLIYKNIIVISNLLGSSEKKNLELMYVYRITKGKFVLLFHFTPSKFFIFYFLLNFKANPICRSYMTYALLNRRQILLYFVRVLQVTYLWLVLFYHNFLQYFFLSEFALQFFTRFIPCFELQATTNN
jgi:hypothetical protein